MTSFFCPTDHTPSSTSRTLSRPLLEFYDRHDVLVGEDVDDCHIWTRSLGVQGVRSNGPQCEYGRVWHKGRTVNAQRAAWECAKGRAPLGVLVRQIDRCESPLCVNPRHWIDLPRSAVPGYLCSTGQWSKATHSTPAVISGNRKRAKINIEIARQIRAMDAPPKVIAEQLGLSIRIVYGVRSGSRWRDHANPWAGLAR